MVGRNKFKSQSTLIKATAFTAVSVAVLSVALVLGYRYLHKAS